MKCLIISRLNTDLKLHKPWPHRSKCCKLLFIHDICSHLKVEICDTIVMFPDIIPDEKGMLPVAVKGSVHKLYLRYLLCKKIRKLLLHFFHNS